MSNCEQVPTDIEKYSFQHDTTKRSAETPSPSRTISSHRQFASTAPLGLFTFATSMFILCMYLVQAKGVTVPNIIVGMALAVGGLVELLAGMWEIANGNLFGGTVFSAYAGFWFSFSLIHIPGSGILAAYEGDAASQLHNAMAIYLLAWTILTLIVFINTLRASFALSFTIFLLLLTFITLTIGYFMEHVKLIRAGGGIGVGCALGAFYVGAAGFSTAESSFVQFPVFEFKKRD